MKPFDVANATNRWIFIPGDTYPTEKTATVAGWRAVITKTKKGRDGESQFYVRMGTFKPVWFNQAFIEKQVLLSD